MAKEKYISLKEAAQLSGYSPDYVGQLIRRGKLQGKQVFSNVAWMTTEEAILDYIDRNNKTGQGTGFDGWRDSAANLVDFGMLYKIVLGGAIALVAVLILLFFYIFSVSIDRNIDRTYEQKIQHL